MKKFLLSLLIFLPLSVSAQRMLSLDECLTLARANNLTLRNAALDIQMAGHQRQEAFTKYFPSISANVMAYRAFDEIIKGDGIIPPEIAMLGPQFQPMIGMPIQVRELNRGYAASVSLMQPVFAGGQIRTGNQLAQLQEEVMQLQLRMQEQDIDQKIRESYWQIVQLKLNLSTLDAADKQLQAVYNLVSEYVNTGVATRNDLLRVSLHQQELAANRIKVQNADRILRLLLAQQTGLIDEPQLIDILVPQGDDAYQLPQHRDALASAANRFEYQLAMKGVEAQTMQVKMERGKLLPTVAVGLIGYHTGFGGLSEGASNYVNSSMTNGMVMGVLSVPITDWWGGSHAIKRQKLKLQQARNTALDAQQQLAIDHEVAWSNLLEAYQQIQVAQASVQQAEENLRMSNDQFRAGTLTLSDLLDAETLHRQAQNNLSSAQASYAVRLSDYQRK